MLGSAPSRSERRAAASSPSVTRPPGPRRTLRRRRARGHDDPSHGSGGPATSNGDRVRCLLGVCLGLGAVDRAREVLGRCIDRVQPEVRRPRVDHVVEDAGRNDYPASGPKRRSSGCSPDFLDADRYPTLEASPPIGSTTVLRTHALRRIRPLADSPTLRPPTGFAGLTWNVGLEAGGLHTLTGDLTMHGVTQPVTFAAKYYGELDDERRDRCRGGVRARAGGGRRGDMRADRCRCDMTEDVPRRLTMTGARRLVAAERARIEASRNARVSSRAW